VRSRDEKIGILKVELKKERELHAKDMQNERELRAKDIKEEERELRAKDAAITIAERAVIESELRSVKLQLETAIGK